MLEKLEQFSADLLVQEQKSEGTDVRLIEHII
jgi:hypothetical protein